jgi:DNA-binding response OmpR family regulator
LRVLLLEDDAPLSSVLIELFASEGLDVTACNTYASLRKVLQAGDPAIVVADFWGASQSTLRQCEADQIRELGRSVPTILLTGRAWAADVTAEELNVACVLAKPIVLDELVAQVRGCLGATDNLDV